MPVDRHLLQRSGELKRDLVAFGQGSAFAPELRLALTERFGRIIVGDQHEIANFLDQFILQHRLADGRTVVDHFVAGHPELPPAERAMLLGWQDVVEGIFAVQGREGDALVVVSLLDEMTYRVYSNMGPHVFAQMPAGSFLVGRLVPIGDVWMVSGYVQLLDPGDRVAAYRAAANVAAQHPALVLRNPQKLALAWELQGEERASFIHFFGTDLLVLPGSEVDERMHAYGHFRLHDLRAAEGRSAADRAREAYGVAPPVVEAELPEELRAAETVGLIYDEVDGLNFLANFGLVQEAFAHPELAADGRHRQILLDYIEDSSISPRLLRRLAEEDPHRASEVFQYVLKQPHFCWQQDGEALLQTYKADYFAHPVLPSVTPLGDTLVRAQLTAPAAVAVPAAARRPSRNDPSAVAVPAAARRPGRNDPCPCGSGKKYKKCCGR